MRNRLNASSQSSQSIAASIPDEIDNYYTQPMDGKVYEHRTIAYDPTKEEYLCQLRHYTVVKGKVRALDVEGEWIDTHYTIYDVLSQCKLNELKANDDPTLRNKFTRIESDSFDKLFEKDNR